MREKMASLWMSPRRIYLRGSMAHASADALLERVAQGSNARRRGCAVSGGQVPSAVGTDPRRSAWLTLLRCM
jgi:hypothetical protein